MSDVSPGMTDSVPQDAALVDVFPIAVQAVKMGDVETLTRLLHKHPTLANARSYSQQLYAMIQSLHAHWPDYTASRG